jgi:hypothetical protein
MGLSGTTDPSVYEGLRDVLQRQPEVTTVSYQPDSIRKRYLRAEIAPERVEPPTGPESPTLDVGWRFADGESQYRIHYADPNTGFSCGWHRDDDHPDLGAVHFQYEHPETGEMTHESTTFESDVPTEVLWRAVERLFESRVPSLTADS